MANVLTKRTLARIAAVTLSLLVFAVAMSLPSGDASAASGMNDPSLVKLNTYWDEPPGDQQ